MCVCVYVCVCEREKERVRLYKWVCVCFHVRACMRAHTHAFVLCVWDCVCVHNDRRDDVCVHNENPIAMQPVALCCSLLQCAEVCCSVLQRVAMHHDKAIASREHCSNSGCATSCWWLSLCCTSEMRHDSFICGTWLIGMWVVPYSFMGQDLFYTCDLTDSYEWHDSFICGHKCSTQLSTLLVSWFKDGTWLVDMWDVTH